MFETLLAGGFVGHLDRQDIHRTESLHCKASTEGGIDSTRESDHDPFQSDLTDFIGNECRKNLLQKLRIGRDTTHGVSMTCGHRKGKERLNQATRDWHSDTVTLSAAKG